MLLCVAALLRRCCPHQRQPQKHLTLLPLGSLQRGVHALVGEPVEEDHKVHRRTSPSRLLRCRPSARPGVLWHLLNMLCRNPRRTSCKPAAGANRPRGICPCRANTRRGWWRRAAPTNGPVVVVQSSTPAAVQPPPHHSYPVLRASYPAGDAVQLQKTSRLPFLLFELPRLANRD